MFLFGKLGKNCTFAPHLRASATRIGTIFAEIAQLVEHNLAKVGVASSSLVFRSRSLEWWNGRHEGLKILWAEMSVRVRVSLRAHYTIADLHYASQLFFICFSSSLEQVNKLIHRRR